MLPKRKKEVGLCYFCRKILKMVGETLLPGITRSSEIAQTNAKEEKQ